MKRILCYFWYHFVMVLTGWLPDNTPFLRLRGLLARPAFKRTGKRLELARHVHMGFPSNIEFGDDVFIGYGSWLQAGGGITIESEVLLAPYVVLIAGDHGMKDGSYRFGKGGRAPIRISHGGWLGAHVTVTKGVTVGRGTLVAAGAVVTKDLPDYCIAGGVPCKVLKENVYQPQAPGELEAGA